MHDIQILLTIIITVIIPSMLLSYATYYFVSFLKQVSKQRVEKRNGKAYYINIYRSTQNGNKPFTDGHCWTSKKIAIDLRRKDVPLYQVYQETISIQIED